MAEVEDKGGGWGVVPALPEDAAWGRPAIVSVSNAVTRPPKRRASRVLMKNVPIVGGHSSEKEAPIIKRRFKTKKIRRLKMPFGDGTGPGGMGPRTGRGFGFCSGYTHPGNAVGRGFGRGRFLTSGRGYGRGMGYGPGFGRFGGYGYTEPFELSPEQEMEHLNSQIAAMEKARDQLRKRVEEIDGKK